MNKYVLKSLQLYVHLLRQKKFKKAKKNAITRDDPIEVVFIHEN